MLPLSDRVVRIISASVLAFLVISVLVICDLTPFERAIVVQIALSTVAISLIGTYLARKYPPLVAALPIIVAALPSVIIGIPPRNHTGQAKVALLDFLIGIVTLAGILAEKNPVKQQSQVF